MGRRKTKKIKPSKSSLALKNRNKPLREFHCHFCQNDRSVWIKISKTTGTASLQCRICGTQSTFSITSLDEPIDVYSYWIDSTRHSNQTAQNNSRDRPRKVAYPEDTLDDEDKTVEKDLDANYSNDKDLDANYSNDKELDKSYVESNYTVGNSVSVNQLNQSADTDTPGYPTDLVNSFENIVKRREVRVLDTQYFKPTDPAPLGFTEPEFVNIENRDEMVDFSIFEHENDNYYQIVDISGNGPQRIIPLDDSYNLGPSSSYNLDSSSSYNLDSSSSYNLDSSSSYNIGPSSSYNLGPSSSYNPLGNMGVYGGNVYKEVGARGEGNFEKFDSSVHNLFSDDQ
ncbi:Transcription elongation factor Elf1 like family protein [Theileria parva strain Muguga]|uniref:Transcription elongation factor 1 homolog n=1 Tax=Theileria parva TaxID=5875 RepID=Q4MZH2_THEPA|nr:Transcription elongation factor Elf1 like family protein [Theileria parva strain Muguga]EAN31292.1 Transcription elongation factor Elf1 like family protein [Theileria parva strain Muguga]|eukprot:XP_763575.1 hypothetical protein [Theileria parva strain Muguga]